MNLKSCFNTKNHIKKNETGAQFKNKSNCASRHYLSKKKMFNYTIRVWKSSLKLKSCLKTLLLVILLNTIYLYQWII